MKRSNTSLSLLFSVIILLFATRSGSAIESPLFKDKLDNGLLLLQKQSDRNDIVCICVLMKISVYDERDFKVGVRAMLADLLLEKICSKTTQKGTRVLELKGVIASTETTPDYMSFTFVTTPSHYKEVLSLIAQELRDYHFSDALYKKEKDAFIKSIESGKDSFSSIYDIFLQNFYRYHPYKLSEETNFKALQKIKKEELEKFIADTISSDRIILALTGNINPEEARDMVTKSFSALSPKPASHVEVQWEPKATEKEVFLSSLSQMAYLILGFPSPSYNSPDYPSMKVLQTLLAEGLNSRLWVELREKRGLAYQLGSYFPELEGPSHMLLYVTAQPQNIILIRRLILKEIENIRQTGVTPQELRCAKAKIFGSNLLARESSKGEAQDMAGSLAIGGKYALDVNMDRKIEDVTSEDIQNVVGRYFCEPTLLVVRPPGAYYIDWFR